MADRRIERILKKYPCDANGIMTAGIDFLRRDLEKAFGKRDVKIRGVLPHKGQCNFEKADGQGGILYCLLDAGHKPKKHKYFQREATGR